MKSDLRKIMKRERLEFSGVLRERADEAIFENFFAVFGKYNSFLIYNSFSSEADTKKIINALCALCKEVYLPRVENNNLVAVRYGDTVKGAFGIEEPCGQAYGGNIDVTVIPLLAVNYSGCRLGYGGGFYDRFLKNFRTVKAGLGYWFQQRDFKEDSWDEPLDFFVCEKGVFEFRNV